MQVSNLPLLLLDNVSMSAVLNEGEFVCSMMSLDEAKAIIEMYDAGDVLRCFSGAWLEEIVYDYLDIQGAQFPFEKVMNMRPGQDAIVFKTYITPSATQPIIETDFNSEAKKIQNIYVHCQYISRRA